ncbi:protein methyltransferase [Didymella exigua CBS 183.55]|uniref:Protein methyltransferase n=1 Tax=Didymella exigua CBS 183.55 TaxID=1150837 RepID=A0A6A5RTL8_9PLEO|nr:protein methyltransferase [Didymella exigua CBS 183.55]KAF1928717.1 protein methyltransferase [Didymella exigua CBS 183.55]
MATPTNKSDVPLQRFPNLYIKVDTPKGRGVFSTEVIPAKTVIEVCPVLVLGLEENETHIEHTSLYHYTYNWPIVDRHGNKHKAQAVILGLGSMFNHSTQHQNVVWERDTERLIITYKALRDIPVGEELCISYGSHLTFKDADAPVAPSPEEELKLFNSIHID